MTEILRNMVRNMNARGLRVKSQKEMDYQPNDANRSTLFFFRLSTLDPRLSTFLVPAPPGWETAGLTCPAGMIALFTFFSLESNITGISSVNHSNILIYGPVRLMETPTASCYESEDAVTSIGSPI